MRTHSQLFWQAVVGVLLAATAGCGAEEPTAPQTMVMEEDRAAATTISQEDVQSVLQTLDLLLAKQEFPAVDDDSVTDDSLADAATGTAGATAEEAVVLIDADADDATESSPDDATADVEIDDIDWSGLQVEKKAGAKLPPPTAGTIPVYLEEVVAGHNRAERVGRENLIFVGYGTRSKTYYRDRVLQILDLEGTGILYYKGTPYKAPGLFADAVFKGQQSKFNFWHLDLAAAGIVPKLNANDYCALAGNFLGVEQSLLKVAPFQHKTFVHMLSDISCRSQATWFLVPNGATIKQWLPKLLDWKKLKTNLQMALKGKWTVAKALANSVNWKLLFTKSLQPTNYGSVYLNLKDNGKPMSMPSMPGTAVHELGHAIGHFMDEYTEVNLADIQGLDALQALLDKPINLTKLVPGGKKLPPVTVNPFQVLLQQAGVFASNCAPSKPVATKRWGHLLGQGEGKLKIVTTKGCLYQSALFYRSSEDSMMRGGGTPFNAYQAEHLQHHFLSQRQE